MTLTITNETENKLLGRREVTGEVTFKGATPKKDDIRNMVASKVKNADVNLTVVKMIDGKYGGQHAMVTAFVYQSVDDLKKLEKYEEPKVEEKQEEAQPEKPAEKTEEPKAEEKPAEEKTEKSE